MFLQLAAKGHEIMIVASLGLIVFHFVREELLFEDGLPLGLIGSGLTFNNLEFFWSKEFYGTLRYVADYGNKPRKILFLILVVVAGIIAALAGPASAVLLVPKSQDWAAGGTQFYLNGSASDLWPDDLSGVMSELRPYCNLNDSTRLGICPAGGFHSLWDHWGTANVTNFRALDRSYAKDISGSNFYWPISSPSSQIPPLYVLGNSRVAESGATTLIQPHAATVVILQTLATDWWRVLTAQRGMSPDQVDDRVISAKFRSAISVVRCANPQNLSLSDKTVNFPSLDGRFNFAQSLPFAVKDLNNTAVKHLRFQWVHIPAKFGAASIGGVLETPWDSNKTSRAVIGCTIQAGWVPATVYTNKYNFWTGWYPWDIQYGDRTPAWSATSQTATNGRIALGDDWLNLLTPPIADSDLGSWRPSTIESMFLSAGLGSSLNTLVTDWLDKRTEGLDKLALIEAIICSVIVDGLSRTGSYRVFNTSESTSEWSLANYNPLPDFDKRILRNKPALEIPAVSPESLTKIEASMQISGFSFQGSLAAYLAMAVLLTHLLMATAHIIYVFRNRQTSSSWGSVAELIALSQNSQPAFDVLANTSAGIESRKTFLQMVKIRVREVPNPSGKSEHVEFIFGDHGNDNPSPQSHQRGSSEHELAELRNHISCQSVTWPLNRSEHPEDIDMDAWSTSTSAERLVHGDRKDKGNMVQPNIKYS
jgi:hypothetical protein